MNHELEIRLEKAEHALRASQAETRALKVRLEALEARVCLSEARERQELLAKAGKLTP